MPAYPRKQSLINNADACSAGMKKAGLVYTSDYSRVPQNILKSRTPTNIQFSAVTGNCCGKEVSYELSNVVSNDNLLYVMDATMSDIPANGILNKILFFRNFPLDLSNTTLSGTTGGGSYVGRSGGIVIIGPGDSTFTDFDFIYGLENIAPATSQVKHTMKNVTLNNLGSNVKDVNALTLVNLDNSHTFDNITINNSQDDGIEIFGGNVNISNLTIQDAIDDYFDSDKGHSGTITNLNLIQTDPSIGKSLIECGNSDGNTTTTFTGVTYNNGTDFSAYTNNSSDLRFNIKTGSSVKINGTTYTAPTDTL